ncbi:MAG TPA: cytochrome c [Acidimicrobiia bacterium]|nr:cytochrome c [Acidimicrobiia bacterium]
MWSEQTRILLTAAIVVLLGAATVAVYTIEIQPEREPAEAIDGRTVFLTTGCTSCHRIEGVVDGRQIGPSLLGLSDRAADRIEGLGAEDYIVQSVLDPEAFIVEGFSPLMPTFPLNTEELGALVEFLLSET